tara:strand:- start:6234 stop:6782 length:549 start_codon:yes stop_codon:yes gene_type:complete
MKNFFAIIVFLFSSSLFAEAKYTSKEILMDKQWSIIVGKNLSWLSSCGERGFKKNMLAEIKSLSKYDYKNIRKGISRGTGTGNKVAIGCSSSNINETKGWIDDYVYELSRLVNFNTGGQITETQGNNSKKKNTDESNNNINNNISNNNSIESKLKKLKSLFDQKLITQEEYDKKRKEILNEM